MKKSKEPVRNIKYEILTNDYDLDRDNSIIISELIPLIIGLVSDVDDLKTKVGYLERDKADKQYRSDY